MCLIGMDVPDPEPDLVGFSIEVKSPGSASFIPLRNRLNFSYEQPVAVAVNGYRNFLSTRAPFQKFPWIHFPYEPKGHQGPGRRLPMARLRGLRPPVRAPRRGGR